MEPTNDNINITNKMCSTVDNFLTSEYDESLIVNSVTKNLKNLNDLYISINDSPDKTNNFDFSPTKTDEKLKSHFRNVSDIKPTPIHISNKKLANFNFEKESKSFTRLQIIQKLLKKESALKQLFIQTSSGTLESIEKECREIYNKKLDVFTTLQKFSRKDRESRQYILVDPATQKQNLRDLNNYIPKFLFYLWDDPKLMVKVLQNTNIKDIKNHLAPLIANNFYENILSVNYIEENYLYILCLLLKDEIESLNSTNDVPKFLQETPCGCLLDQLVNKADIKSYFKIILQNVIENIEINCSEKEINFNINTIEKEIQDSYKIKSNDKNKNSKRNLMVKDEYIFRKDIPVRKTVNDTDCASVNKGKKKLSKNKNDSSESLRTSYTVPHSNVHSFIVKGIKLQENEKNKEKELFDIESYDLFSTKYIPDLNLNELYLRLKTSDNLKMKDYYQFQINNSNQNKTQRDDLEKQLPENNNFYSNERFLETIFKSNCSDMIIYCYQYDFMKVINIIDEIFKSLLNNLPLLPYSIKCLCKMISILVKKKFHGLSNTEENSFIGKFFFCKLFAPIFRNPATLALINKYIISRNTISNLEIITRIILQLVSGRLFRNGGKHTNYTPFNWFFLDQMPSVIKFFDYIVNKVKLPVFIEQCLNDKLDKNFKYDYFEENPDEIICHRSICFNIHDIHCLLENMKNNQDAIFPPGGTTNISLKKTFEKLVNSKINQTIIKTLKTTPVYDKKSELLNKESDTKTTVIQYYLVSDFLYNKKYKYLFLLDQRTPQYHIKELKDIKNNEENIQNNLIKVKNYLNTLLYNYRTLVKTDFEEGTTTNLINILRELKIFMKSSNFVIDGSIPSEWYINSLIESLQKIPKEYCDNDFELLFDSIEKEVNDSISKLDFEILSICLNKKKYLRKNILHYDNSKEILIDILLNNKVNKIIEDDGFKVEIYFQYEKDKKILLINKIKKAEKQLQFLDNMIFQNNTKKGTKLCRSIDAFTKYFPNLILAQKKAGVKDIFEFQNILNLPQRLGDFFDYVREYLIKEKKIKEQKLFKLINEKIYDHVMSKIYDRIFPKEPSKIDMDIYEKTISLSWIEPRHIIPEKTNYVYDSFLPDVINNLYYLDKNKSPRIKLQKMMNIFMTITNIVKFNNSEKDDIGVDDLMPILNYCVIRAQPLRLNSNCRFMELYIGELKNKKEGNLLTQLKSICIRMLDMNHNSLIDVNVKEFEEKCYQCLYDKINSAT